MSAQQVHGGLFDGFTFRLVGFTVDEESKYQGMINQAGGIMGKNYKFKDLHVIANSKTVHYEEDTCNKARSEGSLVVNEFWLEDTIARGFLADSSNALYRPPKDLEAIKGSSYLNIACSGYSSEEQSDIERLVEIMGASFCTIPENTDENFWNSVSYLICKFPQGKNYDYGIKYGISTVAKNWLEDCVKQWDILSIDNYTWMSAVKRNDADAESSNRDTPPRRKDYKRSSAVKRHDTDAGTSNRYTTPPRQKNDNKRNALSTGKKHSYSSRSTNLLKNINDHERSSAAKSHDTEVGTSSIYTTPPRQKDDHKRNVLSTGNKRSYLSRSSTPPKNINDHERVSVVTRNDTNSGNSSRYATSLKRSLDFHTKLLCQYSSKEMVAIVLIPRDREQMEMGVDYFKDILLRAYGSLINIHRVMQVIKNTFSSENFRVNTKTDEVLIERVQLVPYDGIIAVSNKVQFVTMVKQLFKDQGHLVPDDISGWLSSITDGTSDSVLKHHINMLPSTEIFGTFTSLFYCLLNLKDNDWPKFDKIVNSKEMHQFTYWQGRGRNKKFQWVILNEALHYIDPKKAELKRLRSEINNGMKSEPDKANYAEDLIGLLWLIRHTFMHPAMKYQKLLLAVLLREYPYLLSTLQEKLFAAGCLPHLR